MSPGSESILIFRSRDARGTRSIWVRTLEDGSVRIEGQDLGPSVAVFGEGLTEYEWDWTIAATDIPKAVEALGGDAGGDLVAVIRAWTEASNGRDPGQHLQDCGLELGWWSRLGD